MQNNIEIAWKQSNRFCFSLFLHLQCISSSLYDIWKRQKKIHLRLQLISIHWPCKTVIVSSFLLLCPYFVRSLWCLRNYKRKDETKKTMKIRNFVFIWLERARIANNSYFIWRAATRRIDDISMNSFQHLMSDNVIDDHVMIILYYDVTITAYTNYIYC